MHYYLKAKNLFIGDATTAVAGILEIKVRSLLLAISITIRLLKEKS